jgi:glyoxylase-like metal-dependent hydrolase (beta-lactamase superfamily II)/rhodanese-related sulfurtransferase
MIFEQVATGGCQSYLVGCADTCAGALIDPEVSQVDRYLGLATRDGLRIRFVIDTHTHADHFSASRRLAEQLGAMTVMHRASPAPGISMRVDDGESIVLGKLRLQVLHTPGHTADSMCLVGADRVFTGDTLLIGGTGRTDLPSGDPEALYDSLFGKVLALGDAMQVYPAHDYKNLGSSTIGAEKASNPRLAKKDRAEFVALMKGLDLKMPDHLSEALRTNRSGGKTVAQLLAEASRSIAFIGLDDVRARLGSHELVLLDVREKDAFDAGHLPGARHLPRGQLELRVDQELPDPSVRILAYCQFGKISTLAAATLRGMGFPRAVALDGGYDAWVKAGYPTEKTTGP